MRIVQNVLHTHRRGQVHHDITRSDQFVEPDKTCTPGCERVTDTKQPLSRQSWAWVSD